MKGRLSSPVLFFFAAAAFLTVVVFFRKKELASKISLLVAPARSADVHTSAISEESKRPLVPGRGEANTSLLSGEQSRVLPKNEVLDPGQNISHPSEPAIKGSTVENLGAEARPADTGNQADAQPSEQNSQAAKFARLYEQYAPYFDAIGLDSSTRNRVISIMLNERQNLDDIMSMGRSQGLSSADLQKLIRENSTETETALESAVGSSNVPALIEYKRTLPNRPVADATAVQAAAHGVPLSSANVSALAAALTDADVHNYVSNSPVTAEQYQILTENDPRAIALAEKILTPAQMAFFRSALADRIKHQ